MQESRSGKMVRKFVNEVAAHLADAKIVSGFRYVLSWELQARRSLPTIKIGGLSADLMAGAIRKSPWICLAPCEQPISRC